MGNASRRKQSQRPKHKRRGEARGGSASAQAVARQLVGTLYQHIVEGPPPESALDAEMTASDVLRMLALIDNLPEAGAIWSAVGQALVQRMEALATPTAVGFLHGLDLVGPPELAGKAHAAIERLEEMGCGRPTWASGPARFKRGWIGADKYRTREVVVAEFQHPGQRPHALTVLLDPNLGGLLKDVAVTLSARELLKGWSRRAPEVIFRLSTAEQIGGRLRRGLDALEFYAEEDLVEEDVASARAVLLTRLRGLPVTEEERKGPVGMMMPALAHH